MSRRTCPGVPESTTERRGLWHFQKHVVRDAALAHCLVVESLAERVGVVAVVCAHGLRERVALGLEEQQLPVVRGQVSKERARAAIARARTSMSCGGSCGGRPLHLACA